MTDSASRPWKYTPSVRVHLPSDKAARDQSIIRCQMVFMGEPAKLWRHNLGIIVLSFLPILFVLVPALKKEIWKNIH